MRAPRLLLTLALALSLATPALAQWRGGRGGGGYGGYRAGPGGRGAPGGYAPRGGYGARGGGAGGGYGYGPRGGGGYGGDPRGYGGGYGQPAYGGYGGPQPRPAQALRRGQLLPQGYAGGRVADPGRYHLRGAPNGYDWLGDGRDAYLVQRSTGMVLDSVPGAYQPPRAGRGGGRDWR